MIRTLLPLLLLFSSGAMAQDAEPTTLEPVVVTAPRPDPFAFHNPIDYQPTRFDKYWRETSPEQFGMNGGVVPWLNQKIAKGLSKVGRKMGLRQQVQPAVARPSPLTDEQLERASEQQ